MKTETKTEVHVDSSRIPPIEKVEIILRCINSVVEADEEDSEEKKENGKTKGGGQLDKQPKNDWKKAESEEEKEENTYLVNFLKEFKEKCSVIEENSPDVISRGPMRTPELAHHYPKPYMYPSKSRASGGITRVMEGDQRNPNTYRLCYPDSQTFNSVTQGDIYLLEEIKGFLKDPKAINNFVKDCNNELIKTEISDQINQFRSSNSVCSNVSSQFTSPAQSPSEQNLTSPESVTYEDSSFCYTKSPNIPIDSIHLESGDDEDKRSPASTTNGIVPIDPKDLNILPNDPRTPEHCSFCPNIGTVMRNLAVDSYESTIDFNQFANVVDTLNDFGPSIPTTERDLLNEKLDPKAKENAWARISQINIDLLGKGDKEGDTQLMILLVSEKVTLEYVYVIVERLLREHPQYLSLRNDLNQDALYLAAFNLLWEPLIASYIAEALVRSKQDVNMKYEDGNTLLHCLAKQGDSHAKVLERLVKLRHPNRTPFFDINKKNNRGFTPLHIACEVHKKESAKAAYGKEVVHTYRTVKILVENGADCTAKDYKDENTPIHTLINESCDVELLQKLLESVCKFGKKNGASPTTVPNRQENTALHLACKRNSLRLSHQKNVIELLLRHGAMIQLKNINGCVPSVLVDSTRKQEIKTILHSYRQK